MKPARQHNKLEKLERLASILSILRVFDEKKKKERELREQFPFVLSSIKRCYTCTKDGAQRIE